LPSVPLPLATSNFKLLLQLAFFVPAATPIGFVCTTRLRLGPPGSPKLALSFRKLLATRIPITLCVSGSYDSKRSHRNWVCFAQLLICPPTGYRLPPTGFWLCLARPRRVRSDAARRFFAKSELVIAERNERSGKKGKDQLLGPATSSRQLALFGAIPRRASVPARQIGFVWRHRSPRYQPSLGGLGSFVQKGAWTPDRGSPVPARRVSAWFS